jgi:NAD(P)-dependent dehydrogenase (short-subunit alcohol dehydrogenase family)
MTDFSDLQGKVAVITGGGGIIGQALASGMGQAGITVVILDISAERAVAAADSVSAATGCRAAGLSADVTDKVSLVNRVR